MNQYERIVSYIYQYRKNEKGANVGYVRLEKRGNNCRLFVQMRSVPINSMPKVYLYQQQEQGISKIYAGQMMARGGSMLFKANSSAEKLFGSEQGIEEMDGVFIDTEEEVYFASSWKNDSLYLGGQRGDIDGSKMEHTDEGEETNQTGDFREPDGEKETEWQMEDLEQAVSGKMQENRKTETMTETDHVEERDAQKQKLSLQEGVRLADAATESTIIAGTKDVAGGGNVPEATNDATERTVTKRMKDTAGERAVEAKTKDSVMEGDTGKSVSEKKSTLVENDVQMQSICEVCPFKRKAYDYGKKILMTFPSMKPFQSGVARACVRMELQDIGCLPIASWSLSGNRFLLHGYYCYRHLLFAQMEDGRYVLGVPGIYSDRERKNACRFGFSDFQSIGDFGMQQGAFGYWLLELPEENQRFSSK